jgi:hypothetical protein
MAKVEQFTREQKYDEKGIVNRVEFFRCKVSGKIVDKYFLTLKTKSLRCGLSRNRPVNNMKVERFQPCDRLAPYVKEFIVIDTDADAQSMTLPDTSVVMAFRLKGSVAYTKSGAQDIIAASSIAGLRKSVRYFSYQPRTSNILVLFKEGAFRYFFKYPRKRSF